MATQCTITLLCKVMLVRKKNDNRIIRYLGYQGRKKMHVKEERLFSKLDYIDDASSLVMQDFPDCLDLLLKEARHRMNRQQRQTPANNRA